MKSMIEELSIALFTSNQNDVYMKRNPVGLAIVEDTADIREVLVAYFSRQEDIVLIYAAHDAEDLFLHADFNRVHLVICDIGLPHINGVEACWLIKQQFSHVEVMMYTVFENDQYLFDAIKAGAVGYMLKQDDLGQLGEAVREIARGGAVMGPQIARKVMEYFAQGRWQMQDVQSLSDQEKAVAQWVVLGRTTQEIVDEMKISAGLVKFHLRNMYQKLQVHNRQTFIKKFKK